MQVEFLIIGQGISGTFLSYYLQKENRSFLVIDKQEPGSASSVAAGIINPVTGRRIVDTWKIDEILPFAWDAYQQLGAELQLEAITQKNLIDFFSTPQMMLAFEERLKQDNHYLKKGSGDHFLPFFNYDFKFGEIEPVYMVNLQQILPSWRKKLQDTNLYINDRFEISELKMDTHILYKDIRAEKIIFCDGINSFYQNPLFNLLPFAPNKGEVLLVEIPGLPKKNIYKKGMTLAPLENDLFWIGSSYEWSFTDVNPSESFYKKTNELLKHWLKIPYTIMEHKSSIRPATLERRPFVGFHPKYKNAGILNGMGTKGCSLAPYFASQLTQHILNGAVLNPEADINRFNGILSRSVF
jgi:glycine/D-amino acid oxidase-like deaminating enzyme